MPAREPGVPGPESNSDAPVDRPGLERSLTARFPLRRHMALMLCIAFGVGFLANHLLLAWQVRYAAVRWPLDLGVGYAVFFLCMRVWLAYVGVRPFGNESAPGVGSVRGSGGGGGGVGGIGGGGGTSGGSGNASGGGRFGGAGASGSFDLPAGSAGLLGGDPGAEDAIGDAADKGFDFSLPRGGDKGGPAVLAVIALVVVGSLLGSAAYLIVGAPHLLADVAFGAAVTSAFAHGLRRAGEDPDWTDSVFRATWKPFASIGVLLFVAGLAFQRYFPDARTLGEAFLQLQ